LRRFAQFYDAAQSWRRVERIIARVEAGPQGTDTRYIVTNLEGGRAKHLYERLYCARGQAENHIKGVEKLPRRRPHFLPRGRGQPVPSVPARRRLLALMVDAPRHAETLRLARRAVRHLAAAPDQARRSASSS
jgi:hypothetical protein